MQRHLGSSAIWYFRPYPHKHGSVALGSVGWRQGSSQTGKPGLASVISRLCQLWCFQLCSPPGSTEESWPHHSVVWINFGLTVSLWRHKLAVAWLQGGCLLWSPCAQLCFEVGEFLDVGDQVQVFGQVWADGGSLLCFLLYLYSEAFNFLRYLSPLLLWIKLPMECDGSRNTGKCAHPSLPLTFSIICAAFISEIQIIAGCCWSFC